MLLDIIPLMALESGRKLAHYEIVEPIGKGGMGEVYRATDGKLGRDVAINPLWTDDGEQLIFASDRSSTPGLYRMNADGTGAVETLMTAGVGFLQAHDWTPDGSGLLVSGTDSNGGWGVGLFSWRTNAISSF